MQNYKRAHWDELGLEYSKAWEPLARQEMSIKELSLIESFHSRCQSAEVLDVGIGNGRILFEHLNSPFVKGVYGIDISSEMVKICNDRFKGHPNLRQLKVCDVSREKIPFKLNFNLITAIRVLKYNENWRDILAQLMDRLDKGGILVFTMPNQNSINRFAKYTVPYYRASVEELKNLACNLGVDCPLLVTFTRVPDYFYELSNDHLYVKGLMVLENILSFLLGNVFLGRVLFVVYRKRV